MACPLAPLESNLVVLVLHAPGRPDVVVRVHYAHCQGAYLASAAGVSQVTQRLLAAALGPLDTGYGWIGQLPKG